MSNDEEGSVEELAQDQIAELLHWLIKLITRFDNPVGSAHANWEEARANHDRIQAPGVDIIGKVGQPERGQALKNFRLSIRKDDGVVQALVENSKPLRSI
jgi:hypothetical protein